MPSFSTTTGAPATIDPLHASDLRRRRRPTLAKEILQRAEHMAPRDRALLEAIYREGVPARALARVEGVDPRVIRRRVRRLVQRALSPHFDFVLTHREQWPPTRRRVGEALALRGMTQREAAQALGLTLHTVRRHDEAIRTMEQAARRLERAAS